MLLKSCRPKQRETFISYPLISISVFTSSESNFVAAVYFKPSDKGLNTACDNCISLFLVIRIMEASMDHGSHGKRLIFLEIMGKSWKKVYYLENHGEIMEFCFQKTYLFLDFPTMVDNLSAFLAN